ncbi:MAG: hypothetical protein JWO30_4628 [Fibrobacteres bacterium]|nr:hypothetical protein [Fibrobacterota bacterium]
MSVPMPVIFDYMNYRDFLRDYYLWRKKATPSFSYMLFARTVGFASKSFLPHVIEGKKDLAQESVFQIGQGLELDLKAMSYFEDLVAFNQSKDPKKRSHFILSSQMKLFSNWYHSTIRELATVYDFKEDYSALAKMVQPRISTAQVITSPMRTMPVCNSVPGLRAQDSLIAVADQKDVRDLGGAGQPVQVQDPYRSGVRPPLVLPQSRQPGSHLYDDRGGSPDMGHRD